MAISNSIAQLDTALTDYLLCIEAAVFLALLTRCSAPAARTKAMGQLLFATLALASLLGGITHSVVTDGVSISYRVLWTLTLLIIGGIGWSCWNLGGSLLGEEVHKRLASAALLLYSIVVLFVSQRYVIAIGHYLIGVVVLLAALQKLAKKQLPGASLCFIGVLLSVIAPLPHILDYSPLPAQLSPNAAYHLLQALALVAIYRGLATLLPTFEPHTAIRANPPAQ